MSIFFRLCPDDSHTCIDRRCLGGTRDDAVCPLFVPTPATRAAPKQPTGPAQPTGPISGGNGRFPHPIDLDI
jgi:hypothetical protein